MLKKVTYVLAMLFPALSCNSAFGQHQAHEPKLNSEFHG